MPRLIPGPGDNPTRDETSDNHGKANDETYLADAIRVISALDSPLRLRIILKLLERDHVVHELVTYLEKSQPLISQHLRVLKKAGIVTARRSGREVIYSLASRDTATVIDIAAAIGAHTLSGSADAATPYEQVNSRAEESATVTTIPQGKAAIVGPANLTHDIDPALTPDTPSPPHPFER